MTVRRAAIGALVFAMLAALAWFYAIRWKPSEAAYPRQGIDVSHHQGAIDWVAVAENDDVDFAYIKATEGADHRDRRFAENWAGAGSAELSRAPITSSPCALLATRRRATSSRRCPRHR